jgi:surfactin synthase thioesterase subunit
MAEHDRKVIERPSRWIILHRGPGPARVRLFCFPYAGGGAGIFRRWTPLPPGLELCAVQLPGREDRYVEPACRTVTELLAPLTEAVRPHLDLPYAFFGHSMGALIAFELTRELRRQGAPLPGHLFVSARRAPHLPARKRALHALPDAEFDAELRALDGTPAAVLADRELMALMTPVLRADFAVCETYDPVDEPALDLPIHAYGGSEDSEATREELDGWRQHTSRFAGVRIFPGNHFYLQDQAPALVGAMLDALRLERPAR